MAPLVRFGIFALGIELFLQQAYPLLSDAQFTWAERWMTSAIAMVTFAGFGLAGWIAGRLLRTAAELIDVVLDAVEATAHGAELLELKIVPALNRVASALERLPHGGPARDEERARAVATVRRAIESQRWGQAERLIQAFGRDHPDAVEHAQLSAELEDGRQGLIDELRRRLERARAADDLKGVVDARDALTEYLRGTILQDLDRQTARWLMDRIQERLLRSGSVSTELADLSSRIADSFGDTDEGGKLRAALPQIRRRAGLCPRCAQPFRGREAACPRCLAGAGSSVPDASEPGVNS
jgi:hypothetical protein